MPLYSAFTPFGALAFSSRPSRIKQLYDVMIANLNKEPGDNFNLDRGSNIEATIYAKARTQAAARYVLDRAFNNASPGKATDTVPHLEEEYQVAPGPQDSLNDRRAVLAARALLPNGATYTNVVNALTALLGSGFVSYHVTTPSEVISFPATGGDSPGNFALPSTVIKHYRITTNISAVLGSPITVGYVGASAGTPSLLPGDVLTVDAAIQGQTERVTVQSATTTTFVAVFAKAHDENVFATTAPYPFWYSNQRHAIILVTRAVAENADKRRQVNELLHRMLRGVSTWVIAPESSPGSGTPAYFKVGDAVLGRVGYAIIGKTAMTLGGMAWMPQPTMPRGFRPNRRPPQSNYP